MRGIWQYAGTYFLISRKLPLGVEDVCSTSFHFLHISDLLCHFLGCAWQNMKFNICCHVRAKNMENLNMINVFWRASEQRTCQGKLPGPRPLIFPPRGCRFACWDMARGFVQQNNSKIIKPAATKEEDEQSVCAINPVVEFLYFFLLPSDLQHQSGRATMPMMPR